MARHEHTDFEKAFTDGLRFNARGGLGDVLHVRSAGVLDVPSGRLVACDPVLVTDAPVPPFARAVPPGRYPVQLSRWTSLEQRDERIAAAKLVFSAAAPVRWELALREGEEGRPMRRKKDASFPVDSGLGCVMDAERARTWLSQDEAARQARIATARPGHESAFKLGPPLASELVGFSSGPGAGRYRSWWGLDAAGEPVALVVDFDVLYVREWEELFFERLGPGPLAHPRLSELDLQCELLDVWESHRIDRRTTVALRYSSADVVRLSGAEWAVVDASGRLIPTQLSEHREQLYGRWGRLRRLQAATPFPPGARLRLSLHGATRPL